MTQPDHDIAALLAHLEAASSAEPVAGPLPPSPSLESSATMIVMVGTLTEGENGIPLWQSHTGNPWILA